eukprot:3524918-Amphidinium_carterae.1
MQKLLVSAAALASCYVACAVEAEVWPEQSDDPKSTSHEAISLGPYRYPRKICPGTPCCNWPQILL